MHLLHSRFRIAYRHQGTAMEIPRNPVVALLVLCATIGVFALSADTRTQSAEGRSSAVPSYNADLQSRGWSGYVKTLPDADASRGYFAAHAEWRVPEVRCTGLLSDGTSLSIWVGMGGTGNAFPFYQTGTRAECVKGVPHHHAWFERIWAPRPQLSRDEAEMPYDTAEAPVYPGDHMTADVINDRGRIQLSIANLTRGWNGPPQLYGICGDNITNGVEAICAAPSGVSVEAIVESPVKGNINNMVPYPFFQPVDLVAQAALLPGVDVSRFSWLFPSFSTAFLLQPLSAYQPDRLTQDVRRAFPAIPTGGLRQTTTTTPLHSGAFFGQQISNDALFSVSGQTQFCGDPLFTLCIPLHP
jgi:hypothetical protein